MKISLNWIKNYVKPGISVKQLVHKLTMAGLEVEEVVSANKDCVLELEITPNRPDCLNMIGIAREISAILNKPLTLPKVKKTATQKANCNIVIKDTKGCTRYIGTVIEGVNVKSAPAWMKEAIASIGLRPINNLVDITNYSLMENGQPLHAFDYDKLEGGKIIVRRAKKGETIVTLDGVERKLDESILVIADAKKPVAIAGIMGGAATEVTATTKNILLESAHFDQILIRQTSRKLGLSSDSSYRFERSVAYQGVEYGSKRATQLILENAGGKISKYKDAKISKTQQKGNSVKLSVEQINNYLGTKATKAQIKTGLKKLGFSVSEAAKQLKVASPHFRQDILREVDLIEEIARIIGFDNIPISLPPILSCNIPSEPRRPIRNRVIDRLLSEGLDETVTYAMYNADLVGQTGQIDKKQLRVINPLTKEQELMRPSILPSFLSVAATNINRGQKNIKIFEIGKVYTPKAEEETLAILMTGTNVSDWRPASNRPVDFYDLKGALTQALECMDLGKGITFVSTENSFYEKGQSATIHLSAKVIGHIGKVDGDVLRTFGIKEADVYFCEISMEQVYMCGLKKNGYDAIAEYPAVVRDVSIAVKKDQDFGKIENLVRQLGKPILSDIYFKEEYLGEKIANDQRGLVFSLTYQDKKRTLTEEEVNKVHEKILSSIMEEFHAVLR